MSPRNRVLYLLEREQKVNEIRRRAYERRRLQILTLEDAKALIALRQLRREGTQ